MPTIEGWSLLGTMLGLAASAGVNLYLTTLVAGLSIRLGWFSNYPPELELLGHDWVLAVAGACYVVEFFADKIPWVDSIWDVVHTVIRPLGGAFLALRTLGSSDPVLNLFAGLASGGVTLSTHGTKASTRLLVNHSPEPFSNIALSIAEDIAVLGFSWITLHHPLLSLAAVLAFLAAFTFFMPRTFRMLVAQAVFVSSRVRSWFGRAHPERLNDLEKSLALLHPKLEERVRSLIPAGEVLLFAVPCISGRLRAVGSSIRGVVIGTTGANVWFVGFRNFRAVDKALDWRGQRVEVRRRLLVDELQIKSAGPDGLMVLRFDKTRCHLVEQLGEYLGSVGGRRHAPTVAPPT